MKKQWTRYCAALVAAVMLFATALTANDKEASNSFEDSRKPTGEERVLSKEKRAFFSRMYPDAQTEEEELLYFLEAEALFGEELLVQGEDRLVEKGEKEVGGLSEKSLSTTSHLGSFHYPLYITPFGDLVYLEDGSGWAVRSDDQGKVLNWYTNEKLVITPNHDWFSSYDYRIYHMPTGRKIRANVVKDPDYNGFYTHWIVAIDYIHKKVCLEDGSVWSVSMWDGAELKRMAPEDIIIIGTNDSWFKSSRPNILINMYTREYVKARCDY